MTSDRARAASVLVWLLIALTSLGARAPAAHGQAESLGESAAYRALVDQALSEYEAEHFAAARALFVRAHALYPNARMLRGLGMVEFELRNYGASIAHLEAALASPVRPLTGALRERTEQLLARARSFVAQVTLAITPETALLSVDGVRTELPQDRVLVLEVGDHLIELQAAGHAPERRALRVRGGERQVLRAVLRSELRATEPARASRTNAWPWVLIGAAGALTVTGASLLIAGKQKESEVEQAPRGVRWSELDGAYQRATRFNTAAFALGGAGLAGLAGGLVWKLVARGAPEAAPLQLSASRGTILLTGGF